jgi:cytochrome c556
MSTTEQHTQPSRDGGFSLRNPIDFTIVGIYLQEGGIQTRTDGSSGFYYYAADRENGLRFVPTLKTVQPYAHYLRERLPFYEGDLEKMKQEVDTIQKKLDDPDFQDVVQRQSLTNKMGTIELHIKSQFKEWEKKAQELDEEEENDEGGARTRDEYMEEGGGGTGEPCSFVSPLPLPVVFSCSCCCCDLLPDTFLVVPVSMCSFFEAGVAMDLKSFKSSTRSD